MSDGIDLGAISDPVEAVPAESVPEQNVNTLTIRWVPEQQGVQMHWSNAGFKNPDFILAVLDMAKATVEDLKRRMLMQGVAQAELAQKSAVQQEALARRAIQRAVRH